MSLLRKQKLESEKSLKREEENPTEGTKTNFVYFGGVAQFG